MRDLRSSPSRRALLKAVGAAPILLNVAASMRALVARGALPVSPSCMSIGEGV